MAKKKVSTANIVLAVAGLLGIVAIFMMFAPGISSKTVVDSIVGSGESETTNYAGFKLMFGTDDGFQFNFMMFLSLIFSLVGVAGVVLSIVLKGKIGNYLAIGGFLLAGIFFFLFRAVFPMGIKDMVIGTATLSGKEAIDALEKGVNMGVASAKTTFSLGVGAIVAGILGILAALASAAATFAIKK